jgi:hypothetical protein
VRQQLQIPRFARDDGRSPARADGPARAIGWEFRRRHRWGLIALGCYLTALAIIKLLILESGRHINLDSPESFAFVVVIPMTATFTYFLAVFTFGLEGDLAARQSMYPARMFTRPVTAAALAGWPMLYGCAATVILWMATRLLTVWPSDIEIPSVWPAFLAASLLAWTQALTWMPYPLPGLRIVITVFWLATIDAIVLLALHFRAHEPAMLAILAPQVPLAYFAARFAVARARRGEIPDWRRLFVWLGQTTDVLTHRRGHFSSPTHAQTWLEWRQHGRSLPVWVAILLPLELTLLRVTGDTPALVFTILAGVLVTPPFMAVFAAATVRGSNPSVGSGYGLSPFIATRPLTTAALTAAKLRATIWSTGVTWALVLVAIPLALKWTDRWPMVVDRIRERAESIGTPRTAVLLLLILSGLILWTWKQLVQSLYIGLSGRERLIKGSLFVTLALLFLIGPIVQLVVDNKGVQRTLWDALPLILAILVCVKMSIAGWIATRLYRSRLLSDRMLVMGAAGWCVVVLALYGVLAWWMDTPFFPRYVLLLLAILGVPLARLSAAPLALAWNRHR